MKGYSQDEAKELYNDDQLRTNNDPEVDEPEHPSPQLHDADGEFKPHFVHY